jgi:NAD(P)-dependent dehydrogenase (short-subunit alcohol dehydrogenase family)
MSLEISRGNQSGKRILITGTTSGIGWNTAMELARANAEVTIPARSQAKADDAAARIRAVLPQAKLKTGVMDLSRAWVALGKNPPRSFGDEQQRYAREQAELAQVARQKERVRDQKSAEADHLLHQHHRFADSVALLQVAIALAAVAALTRVRLIWFGSIIIGLGGTSLFLLTALVRLRAF